MKELRINLGENSYPIYIDKGLRKEYGKLIRENIQAAKVVIITDKNVDKFYGEALQNDLKECGFEVQKIVIQPGEQSKSFETLPMIYEQLTEFRLTRSDLIVALGGGVVGDLAGFVASTYLRGVAFVQIPTSLLAQVDSSVGGKVAIDLPQGKNLVGSFHHPKMVLIDPEVLDTLEEKFVNDGMGEVIKYACIKDIELFHRLQAIHGKEALKEEMDEIIYRCCDIKRQIVENDEKDIGERMILNFGHTLGHAIEKVCGYEAYTHGEGVAIGMYQITKQSESMKLTKEGTSNQVLELLKQYNLPCTVEIPQVDDLLKAIGIDKKNMGNSLNIILLHEIGRCFIHQTTQTFFENMRYSDEQD